MHDDDPGGTKSEFGFGTVGSCGTTGSSTRGWERPCGRKLFILIVVRIRLRLGYVVSAIVRVRGRNA